MPDKKGFFRLGYSKVADEADIVLQHGEVSLLVDLQEQWHSTTGSQTQKQLC